MKAGSNPRRLGALVLATALLTAGCGGQGEEDFAPLINELMGEYLVLSLPFSPDPKDQPGRFYVPLPAGDPELGSLKGAGNASQPRLGTDGYKNEYARQMDLARYLEQKGLAKLELALYSPRSGGKATLGGYAITLDGAGQRPASACRDLAVARVVVDKITSISEEQVAPNGERTRVARFTKRLEFTDQRFDKGVLGHIPGGPAKAADLGEDHAELRWDGEHWQPHWDRRQKFYGRK